MNTEQVVSGMSTIHDVLVELFFGNDANLNLLACVNDNLETTASKLYPASCAIINHILTEMTVKIIDRWGFEDTVARDCIYQNCSMKDTEVIKILEKYKGN